MGTNAIKTQDFLHGGKPSSHGRKERRFMANVLRQKGINDPTAEVIEDALHRMHLRESIEDLADQLIRDKISIENVVITLGYLSDYYKEQGYGN